MKPNSNNSNTDTPTANKLNNSNQKKLNNFFEEAGISKPSPKSSSMLSSSSNTTTPASKSFLDTSASSEERLLCPERRVLTAAERDRFIEEVNCFFEDINMVEVIGKGGVKVNHLRSQLEQQRGERLTLQLKKFFMELVGDKVREFKQSVLNPTPSTSTSSTTSSST